jgi:hypothetical protein
MTAVIPAPDAFSYIPTAFAVSHQPTIHDASESCSLCRVQDVYTRSQCGSPQFARLQMRHFRWRLCCCTQQHPAQVRNQSHPPGGLPSALLPYLCFATQQECEENCNTYYSCINDNQCVKARQGTPAKYPSLTACNDSCSTAPISPCGRVKPAQCKFWPELFDATVAPGDGRKTNEIRLKPAAAERGSRSRPFECTKPNGLCLYRQPVHFLRASAHDVLHMAGCVAKILS